MLLFQDGFDNSFHKWTSNTGVVTFYTDRGVWSNGALAINVASATMFANTVRKIFKPGTDTDVSNPFTRLSFWFRANGTVTTNSPFLEIGDQSKFANSNGRFTINTAGKLVIHHGASGNITSNINPTALAEYGRLDDTNWHHIELGIKYNNANGNLQLTIDGTQIHNFINGNTTIGGQFLRLDYVTLSNPQGATGQVFFYDDLMVWDDYGAADTLTGPQGPMRIYTLRPSADIYVESTPSTGNNRYLMLDDLLGPNNDSDYVTLSPYQKDIYELDDLYGPVGAIKTATATIVYNSSNYGRANVRPFVTANGFFANGNVVPALTRTYLTPSIQHIFNVDFGNSNVAWTNTSISGLQIGVENVG